MTDHQTARPDLADLRAKLERIELYLASDPGNLELLASAIDLQLEAGNADAALRHAEEALARYPGDPHFRHRLAGIWVEQGKLEQAEPLLTALLAEIGDSAIAFNLASLQFQASRYADCAETLAPCIDGGEVTGRALTLYLRALHHAGKVSHALEVVQRYMDAYGADSEFLAVASLLYVDGGQMGEAQRLSAAALAGGQPPLEALVANATAMLAQGRPDDAILRFSEAVALQPQDGRSWSGLGMASLLKQDLPAAQQQLTRALRTMPSHIGTWHALGWSQILQRDAVGAEASFQKALELDRNFGESHGGLAVAEAMQGKADLAAKSIERALGLNPHGLAARYAQMILSGDAADPARFTELAMRILSSREMSLGGTLADWVSGQAGKGWV
jgi:Flp pilus assembly protein TadD